MRLVYIAGPYRSKIGSREEVDLHIATATQIGSLVAEKGDYPIIPHKNTEHFERFTALKDEFFLDGTLEAMRRCDAVVLCPGWRNSTGTQGEITEANRLGIPVHTTVEQMYSTEVGKRYR